MLYKYKFYLENFDKKTTLGVAGTAAIITGGLMYNNHRKNNKEKERILNKIEEIKKIDCSTILKDLHRESCILDKKMTLKVLKEKLSKL